MKVYIMNRIHRSRNPGRIGLLLSLVGAACSSTPATTSWQPDPTTDGQAHVAAIDPSAVSSAAPFRDLEAAFEALKATAGTEQAGPEWADALVQAQYLREYKAASHLIERMTNTTGSTALLVDSDEVRAYVESFLPFIAVIEAQRAAGTLDTTLELRDVELLGLIQRLANELPDTPRPALEENLASIESDLLVPERTKAFGRSHFCCEIWVIEDPQPTLCIGYKTAKAWARAKCYATAASIPLTYPVLASGTCANDPYCSGF